jgi:hypothetical protein
MSDSVPNVSVSPNVMVETPEGTQDLHALPGDFAFAVYKRFWPTPESARQAMTPKQYQEYQQYQVCLRCNRPCAGTCDRSRGHR